MSLGLVVVLGHGHVYGTGRPRAAVMTGAEWNEIALIPRLLVDADPATQPDIVWDLSRKGWPIPTGSASHVIDALGLAGEVYRLYTPIFWTEVRRVLQDDLEISAIHRSGQGGEVGGGIRVDVRPGVDQEPDHLEVAAHDRSVQCADAFFGNCIVDVRPGIDQEPDDLEVAAQHSIVKGCLAVE